MPSQAAPWPPQASRLGASSPFDVPHQALTILGFIPGGRLWCSSLQTVSKQSCFPFDLLVLPSLGILWKLLTAALVWPLFCHLCLRDIQLPDHDLGYLTFSKPDCWEWIFSEVFSFSNQVTPFCYPVVLFKFPPAISPCARCSLSSFVYRMLCAGHWTCYQTCSEHTWIWGLVKAIVVVGDLGIHLTSLKLPKSPLNYLIHFPYVRTQ